MAHFTADTMTAGPAPANHVGINTVITNYTLAETASGSTTISLTPLPAGAEVVHVTVYGNHANLQATAGALVSVYATIAGSVSQNYIRSATYATVIRETGAVDVGKRITASANLVMRLSECAGTGTGNTVFRVVTEYLARKRGD